MAHQFLVQGDPNVFCVDWRGGSQDPMYPKAVANTRVVASEISRFIKFLETETKAKNLINRIHLIGHSLGAHIAGFVGHSFKGELQRITGLDPADPYFQNKDPWMRLDEGDAKFVDVLHTDAGFIGNSLMLKGGFGTWQPSGHVDIYVNGGIEQAGCNNESPIASLIHDGVVDGFRLIFSCHHLRSYLYMTESIGTQCPFKAYPCESWKEFQTGRCLHCSNNSTCNGLGLKSSPSMFKQVKQSKTKKYWLATGESAPFCRYHYHVKLTLAPGKNSKSLLVGKIWFRFPLLNDEELPSVKENEAFVYGRNDLLFTSTVDLFNGVDDLLEELEIKWKYDGNWFDIRNWFSQPTIYPRKLSIFSGENQIEQHFCVSPNQTLPSGESLILRRC